MINPRPGRDNGVRPVVEKKPPTWIGPGVFQRSIWTIDEGDVAWAWTAGALMGCPGATAFCFTSSSLKTIVCIVPPDGHGLGFVRRFSL